MLECSGPGLLPWNHRRQPDHTINTATEQRTTMMTLEEALKGFVRALSGRNRSPATIRAYQTDVDQFIRWIHQINLVIQRSDQVERVDVTEYLAHLGGRRVSGVSRARKLAAIGENFRFLEENQLVAKSPAPGEESPHKERNGRTYLRPDEYTKLLSLARSPAPRPAPASR